MRTIALMGALPEEVALLVSRLAEPRAETYGGVCYHQGFYGEHPLVVCCAGMGKANAAATTQVLITKYKADAIVFSGIAGNTCPQLAVGDVVIGSELCYHDATEELLAQSPPGIACYPADPHLLRAAEKACQTLGVRYKVGKIATGDQFIDNPGDKRRICRQCAPLCVEMEGAAVAQTALRNGCPFVVLRAMSDNAEQPLAHIATAQRFHVEAYAQTAAALVLEALNYL